MTSERITTERENENVEEIKLTVFAEYPRAVVETLDSINEFIKDFKEAIIKIWKFKLIYKLECLFKIINENLYTIIL